MVYSRNFSPAKTSQTQKTRDDQVINDAGGYVFPVDKWTRLERFLITGNEGGTYYSSERVLITENVDNAIACIKEDGVKCLNIAGEISHNGRTVKNEPAILVLALYLIHFSGDMLGYKDRHSSKSVSLICRTGTHILHLASYIKALGHWGRSKRSAIASWYETKSPDELAYQVVKYQSRDKWSHRDLLRLSHPKTFVASKNAVYHWITKGVVDGDNETPSIIKAFEKAKTANKNELITLINEHNLSREMIPTEHLKDIAIQAALFRKMPMTALIKNLGNMTASGLFNEANIVNEAVARITNVEVLKKSRIHPISLLIAMMQYSGGASGYGHNTWNANPKIIDALNDAFYLSFSNAETTNKRILVAVDKSGSMHTPTVGAKNLSATQAASALALVISSTEPNSTIVAFDTETYPTTISARQRLDDATKQFLNGGGTDCSSPIEYAIKNKIVVDVFVILTDSQTWAGDSHPYQALLKYRKAINSRAALIVVACADNAFTISSPEDKYSMDVCGFDANIPSLITNFLKGLDN